MRKFFLGENSKVEAHYSDVQNGGLKWRLRFERRHLNILTKHDLELKWLLSIYMSFLTTFHGPSDIKIIKAFLVFVGQKWLMSHFGVGKKSSSGVFTS